VVGPLWQDSLASPVTQQVSPCAQKEETQSTCPLLGCPFGGIELLVDSAAAGPPWPVVENVHAALTPTTNAATPTLDGWRMPALSARRRRVSTSWEPSRGGAEDDGDLAERSRAAQDE
jgi:hypothetical protein